MKKNYEYLYSGSTSALDPNSGDLFTGYRIPAASLGAPTSPQTADQLREVSSRLNEGMNAVEMGTIQAGVFDTIPKQHMKEMNRLTKLTGSEISVHAPIIDPAGFSQEGGWSDANRASAERQLYGVIERSHELNPEGRVPVTIHADNVAGHEYRVYDDGKGGEEMIIGVDQETGQMTTAKRVKRYYPETGNKEQIISAKDELNVINRSNWSNHLLGLRQYKKQADELIEPALREGAPYFAKLAKGIELTDEEKRIVMQCQNKINRGASFLNNTNALIRSLYNQAYKFGDEGDKRMLEGGSEEYKDLINKSNQSDFMRSVQYQSGAVESLIHSLSSAEPKIYKPIDEFAIEKASQTIGNIAFESYKKYGDTAPMISLENTPAGQAISRAEDLKKLIVKSRERFVEQAVKKGLSTSNAEKQAEEIIGATWDVGHINLLRKGGFSKEQIVEETKKIAPYVKHVHLTDNFGYSDSHLPIGMGEVPVKEMMKELEKAGYSGRHIAEAGGFVKEFKTSPHPYVLEAFGSPLYSAYMQPFWNQARGSQGAYSAGYGTMLPEQHFSIYGSGFSTLPVELGGQQQGKQSRFSGTPTE
ncbi:MAG: sugar phosphate isomerase/epimerase [archaeon]